MSEKDYSRVPILEGTIVSIDKRGDAYLIGIEKGSSIQYFSSTTQFIVGQNVVVISNPSEQTIKIEAIK